MRRVRSAQFGQACRGIVDPAAVTGSEEKIAAAFDVTYDQMSRRIENLLALGDMNETSLKAAIAEIGNLD